MGSRATLWTPRWEGSIEAMTVYLCRKHMWRFAPLYDFDDLWQDCYLIFLECCDRYPHVVDGAHFRALVRTCIKNHFHDLSKHRAVRGGIAATPLTGHIDPMDALPAKPLANLAPIEATLADVPAPHRAPLRSLLAGLNKPRRARHHRRRKAGGRETTNAYLCRIAGLDPTSVDLQGMVRAWLSPA